MKRLYIICIVFLCTTVAYSQLIGEGDTLWAKSGLPTIKQVQFSPDGTKLGVLAYGGDYIGRFFMYDANTGEELWTFTKATYYFNQFSYSLDGSKLYILPPSDNQINIIDINTGEILDTLPVEISLKMKEYEVGNYRSVYQTKNPNILLIGNPSMCFALYDISKRQIIKELFGNRKNKFYASPNSDYFINAYQYKYENKWITRIVLMDINTLDVNTAVILGEENALVETSGSVRISYNGKYAATNFGSSALSIWDLENKKLFKKYTPTIPTETMDGIGGGTGLTFSHDNENIINSGGGYVSHTTMATTLTNFISDKRTLIYPSTGFHSIDIDILNTKLAGGNGDDIIILKFKTDVISVKDQEHEFKFVIYPNPTTNNVTIGIPEHFGLIRSAQLLDSSGKLVKSFLPHELIYQGQNLILSLNGLMTGVYYLQLSNLNTVLSYQIILER